MPKKITQNVNKDKFFNDLPKVRVPMSKWSTRHTNYQSCNLGQIVPIYYDEVLPGEKRSIKLGMISHTTTPIAPIFPALYTELRTFFVPHRLSADLLNGYKDRKSPWVKVFGEDNASTSADIVVPLAEQKLPELSEYLKADMSDYWNETSVADNVFDSLDLKNTMEGDSSDFNGFNFLNLAAYELVYQFAYRNENLEASTSSVLYRFLFNGYNRGSSVVIPTDYTFEIANKEKDYFTGAKPFTQKGDAPIVSVGGTAPLKVSSEFTSLGTTASNKVSFQDAENGTYKLSISGHDFVDNGIDLTKSNIVADLSSAKGVSINELRLLIKTQELLEKDAMYGSRYSESLNAHFGTAPLDTTLQEPQELYRTTITSQMQAIFQTSTTSGEASILGTIGANSTTSAETIILPETEFKEHGLIIICACHKLQNVYNAGLYRPRFNLKQNRFDFYTPELNDLGYQKSMDKESPLGVFYNEAFAEYRYKFNKAHGSLNDEFPYWAPTLDTYGSLAAIYKEKPAILDKALSIHSDTAPQFYDAWGFEETNTKPMSLHSIPGMDGVI